MCTVSFVSVPGKKIISSNRDEHIARPAAAAPRGELINGQRIFFPKDPQAGGTWFAVSGQGAVSVLLNGAFIKHPHRPPYRRSRGLILLDIIATEDPLHAFAGINLDQVEPFTMVHYQAGQLHEWRWDGAAKHENSLDPSGNHIWSSATLYPDEVVQYRKSLFDRFIAETPAPEPADVYAFHAHNNNDPENGFVINRQTGLQTFSITQAVWQPDRVHFTHSDLRLEEHSEQSILLETHPVTSS